MYVCFIKFRFISFCWTLCHSLRRSKYLRQTTTTTTTTTTTIYKESMNKHIKQLFFHTPMCARLFSIAFQNLELCFKFLVSNIKYTCLRSANYFMTCVPLVLLVSNLLLHDCIVFTGRFWHLV